MLNCRLAYGVGSGLAARIAGDAIGADADLPHMGTEEFLSCLSRAALEAEASRHRVLPRGRVKDTRAALIEQVRETCLVLPAAQFALTEQESSDFAKKVSYYAYDDEAEGEEATRPSTLPPLPRTRTSTTMMATSTRSRRLKSKPPITPTPVTRRASRTRPGAAAWSLKALGGAPVRRASHEARALSDTIRRGRRRRPRPSNRPAATDESGRLPL